MDVRQVREYFEGKENVPCPLTEKLIKAGYQQTSGGYIDAARKQGIEIDYRNAKPSQYWHLICEYCPSVGENKEFGKNIVCGELIFWMAEVSGAVPKEELSKLVDEIIAENLGTSELPKYDRKKWNRKIQELCFDAVSQLDELFICDCY